ARHRDEEIAGGIRKRTALHPQLSQHEVVLERDALLVAQKENGPGIAGVRGEYGVVRDLAPRGIAYLDGDALSGDDEIVADNPSLHVEIGAGRVSERDRAVATHEQIALDGDVLAAFPQENPGPAPSGHSPDVLELVIVDFPSFDLHHVHARYVVAVEFKSGYRRGDGRLLLESAESYDAVPGYRRVGAFDGTLADIDEIHIVDEKVVIAARLDLYAVGPAVAQCEVREPHSHGFYFDQFFIGV